MRRPFLILLIVAVALAQYTPPPGFLSSPTSPAAPTGSLQYNNSGAFGALAHSNWDGLNLNIQDSSGTYNIFTLSADMTNGDPDCAAFFTINCDNARPPANAGSDGTQGLFVNITAARGGDTTNPTTATGGRGGDGSYGGGLGGDAPNAIVNSTGGRGGDGRFSGNDGGLATTSGSGVRTGGTGGDAIVYGGFGKNAAGGSANHGGDAGIVQIPLSTGGTGSTSNGLDSYLLVDGSGLRGNRTFLARFVGPNSVPVPQIRITGAIQPGILTFAQLTTAAGTALAFDQFGCSDCKVTSGADSTCATGGGGAMAFRIASAWKCLQ
jgi:hypothetical protein